MDKLTRKNDSMIIQEDFDRLLDWLDPDRERAGEKYEHIRRALLEIFTKKRCSDAEDLANETINRVTAQLQNIQDNYSGDPALYFYGVARRVCAESARRAGESARPVNQQFRESPEFYDCLERCLDKLGAQDRELILSHYQTKRDEIQAIRELEGRFKTSANALRVRTHRIRRMLKECVLLCIEKKG